MQGFRADGVGPGSINETIVVIDKSANLIQRRNRLQVRSPLSVANRSDTVLGASSNDSRQKRYPYRASLPLKFLKRIPPHTVEHDFNHWLDRPPQGR